MKKLLRHPAIYALVAVSAPVCALESITDKAMSDVSGQAFITVDASSFDRTQQEWEAAGLSSNNASEFAGSYEFTKINLGLDIETIFTADSLRVGEFERTVYEDGTVPATTTIDNPDIAGTKIGQAYDLDGDGQFDTLPADIIIENFALGRVVNYRDAATAVIGSKADGGDPFRIRDPFIELAYKIEGGERRISGVRIGLGQAKGWLSGDILSLTGVLQGSIKGPAGIVYDKAPCNGNAFASTDCFLLSFAQSTEIYSEIGLVDGAINSPNYGYGAGTEEADPADGFTYPYADELYLKRAAWAGVPAGRNFKSDFGGVSFLIPSLTVSQDCTIEGTPGCFALSQYQSIYVGNNNEDSSLTFDQTAASGAFISLQTESVPWEDLSGLNNADRVLTQRGAFLNLAKYKANNVERFPLILDLTQAVNGVPRVATCVGLVKGC